MHVLKPHMYLTTGFADREIFPKHSSDSDSFSSNTLHHLPSPNELNSLAPCWHLDPSVVNQDWPVSPLHSGHAGYWRPGHLPVLLSDEDVCLPRIPVPVRCVWGLQVTEHPHHSPKRQVLFFFLYASISQVSFLSVSLLTICFQMDSLCFYFHPFTYYRKFIAVLFEEKHIIPDK